MITRIIPTCWFSFIGLLVLIDKILQSGFMVGLPLELISKMRRKEYVSVTFGYTSLKYDRFDDVYGRLTEYFKKNLS